MFLVQFDTLFLNKWMDASEL